MIIDAAYALGDEAQRGHLVARTLGDVTWPLRSSGQAPEADAPSTAWVLAETPLLD